MQCENIVQVFGTNFASLMSKSVLQKALLARLRDVLGASVGRLMFNTLAL